MPQIVSVPGAPPYRSAVVREFAARGDRVVLLARGEWGLARAANDVRRLGGTPLAVAVDVADADADAVASTVERVEAEGRTDRRVGQRGVLGSVRAVLGDVAGRVPGATKVSYLGAPGMRPTSGRRRHAQRTGRRGPPTQPRGRAAMSCRIWLMARSASGWIR